MGKPASNGGSVFHFGNFWYNAFHGFLSILLFFAKKKDPLRMKVMEEIGSAGKWEGQHA